jgi:DNA-binding NarL/FixJ family response regulator
MTSRTGPPAEPAPSDNTAARTSRGSGHVHMALTVVIVDDHAGFRSLARACLEADGFTVLGEAEDGASAVDVCQRLDPDVVLLDVVLPDVDGFEVCAHLTSGQPMRPAVVLTSSRPAASYTTQLHASTARGFVAKEDITGAALRALVKVDK